MKFLRGAISHLDLTNVTADEHHAQLHRISHESGGADRVGQNDIRLSNAFALQGLTTAAVARSLALVDGADDVQLGSSSLYCYLNSSSDLTP